VGLSVFGISLLLTKLGIYEIDIKIGILIGAVSALIGGALAFVFNFRSEKRIAARLDREFDLKEKVGTMVAFKNDTSRMAALQREDTERHLCALDSSRFGFSKIFTYLGCAVASVAILTVALILPVKAQDPSTPDTTPEDPYEISMWQITALEGLIEDVKESAMHETAKDQVIAQLEALLSKLEKTDTVSTMKESVIAAIEEIYSIVDRVNILPDMKALMEASDLQAVKIFRDVLGTYDLPITLSLMEDIRALAEGSDTEAPEDVSSPLRSFLDASGLPAEAGLFKAVMSFAVAMASPPDADSADMFYTAHVSAIRTAIIAERVNIGVRDMTVTRLADIFELSSEELPLPDTDGDKDDYEDEEREDEEDGIHDGGLGGNQTLYGSSDAVFDPESGEYVTYGDIINNPKYYPTSQELTRGDDLSEELKKFLAEYYGILFDGSEDEDGDQ
jgi:hypothetical protein